MDFHEVNNINMKFNNQVLVTCGNLLRIEIFYNPLHNTVSIILNVFILFICFGLWHMSICIPSLSTCHVKTSTPDQQQKTGSTSITSKSSVLLLKYSTQYVHQV